MSNKQPFRYTVDLGQDQHSALQRIAEEKRVSRSAVVRWAIDDFILRGGIMKDTIAQNGHDMIESHSSAPLSTDNSRALTTPTPAE